MKVTRLGRDRPIVSPNWYLGGGSVGAPGSVLVSNGSNGVTYASNILSVTVNGSPRVLGPDINFADGSNTAVTVDMTGAVASNMIRIHSTGGGGASFGSNSNQVSFANSAGASSNTSRSDHVHLGATSVAHSSNTFSGPITLEVADPGWVVSPTPGTFRIGGFRGAGGQAAEAIFRTRPMMISPASAESCGTEIGLMAGAFASANSSIDDSALFVPFLIAETITAVKMWWLNGAAVAGTIDVGIYDAAGTRLVSIGPTSQAGTNVIQEVNIADTALAAGLYYLAFASDTSGATQRWATWSPVATTGGMRSLGVLQVDGLTSGTLPSSVTYAICTTAVLPVFGLSARTLIV